MRVIHWLIAWFAASLIVGAVWAQIGRTLKRRHHVR